MATTKAKILEILMAGGYKTDRELATHLGKPIPSVRRSRNQLVAEGKVVGSKQGSRLSWSIKREETTPSEAST